jgi:hypothetical protein
MCTCHFFFTLNTQEHRTSDVKTRIYCFYYVSLLVNNPLKIHADENFITPKMETYKKQAYV